MNFATWIKVSGMNRRHQRALVEELAGELDLPATATHQQVSRRVCEVMSRRLGARVEVRFTALTHLTGATALLDDGSYVVVCANTPSWYHRLQILLHEFAHRLLGHEAATLSRAEGLRRYMPHLLPRMAHIIASRTTCGRQEERDAEELADALLERLTEPNATAEVTRAATSERVRRLAETIGHRPGWTAR